MPGPWSIRRHCSISVFSVCVCAWLCVIAVVAVPPVLFCFVERVIFRTAAAPLEQHLNTVRGTPKRLQCAIFSVLFPVFSLSVTVINDGPAPLLLFHEYQQQKQHLSRTVMLVFSRSSSSTEQIKLCLCSNREWLCFTVSFTSHFFWRWITAAKSAD